jgi:hypothetical protein
LIAEAFLGAQLNVRARHDVVIGQRVVAANIEYSPRKSQAGLSTAHPESFNLSSEFNREYIFVTVIPAAAIDDEIDRV